MIRTKHHKYTARSFAICLLLLASMLLPAPATAMPVITIIGGHEPDQNYSGIASLQINTPDNPDTHICGAALVSRTYAVTSAHCATYDDATPADPSLFRLRIGSTNRTDGGTVVGVTKVLPHADWNWMQDPTKPASDIALLQLGTYVQQQPFEVAPRLAKNNATTRLLGWGVTEPSSQGPLPLNLQELDTKIIKNKRCKDATITAGELCINNVNGTDGPCFADSGSPALQRVNSKRWSIVGTMSRFGGSDCGVGNAVYTDITYFRTWMYSVMRSGTVPESTHNTPKPKHTSTALTFNAWRHR